MSRYLCRSVYARRQCFKNHHGVCHASQHFSLLQLLCKHQRGGSWGPLALWDDGSRRRDALLQIIGKTGLRDLALSGQDESTSYQTMAMRLFAAQEGYSHYEPACAGIAAVQLRHKPGMAPGRCAGTLSASWLVGVAARGCTTPLCRPPRSLTASAIPSGLLLSSAGHWLLMPVA